MLFAVAPNAQPHFLAERIHHARTNAVQTARDLVAVLVEFPAGVEHGHDDFGSAAPFAGLDAGGNAAPVVGDGDRVILVNDDVDLVAIPGQRFVDRVVDDLEHHV